MKNFTSADDVSDPIQLAHDALQLKKQPFQTEFGQNKTLGLFFMNPSLRTRLSTQIAGRNLGMEVIVFNQNDGWPLEYRKGVTMDGPSSEHVIEAAGVLGRYCDVIGIRTFPTFQDREEEYNEPLITAFKQYAGVPIVSLESNTFHPLQSLADLMTIESLKQKKRPKVVLTWAPHIKPLPQSVANSFVDWMKRVDYDLVVTHPPGYELNPAYVEGVSVTNDQDEALAGADFVYAKNWSSFQDYGAVLSKDPNWRVSEQKMALTNDAWFMHCLPVRRNLVVADEVLDSNRSAVLMQSENRTYAAQMVLKTLIDSM